MSNQLQTVESVIVLMLENRGFDNVMGFLHTDDGNKTPNGDSYNGLTGNETNPANSDGTSLVPVQREMDDSTVPDPDPQEEFDHVTDQLFIPKGMYNKGFVIDYGTVKNATAADIMRCYDASLTPCLQHIANHYAVCDAWYSSVPSQTWPNRSFVHCGWSNDHFNNFPYDPFQWSIRTIFNEMAHSGKTSWCVYYDEAFIALTRLQFPELWKFGYSKNFKPFKQFLMDASSGRLPNYAFVEPNFFHNPITGEQANDQHPPHDVTVGDTFIGLVYNAVVGSKQWKDNKVLFIITHDEHGGTYDHVTPPSDATPPTQGTGDEDFDFTRFGVRVPFVIVSPYIPKGSVIQVPQGKTFDHTSILATLEKLYNLPALKDREKVAPDLGDALSLPDARKDTTPYEFPPEKETFFTMPTDRIASMPLNELQISIVHAIYNAVTRAPAEAPEMGVSAEDVATMQAPEEVRTIGQA